MAMIASLPISRRAGLSLVGNSRLKAMTTTTTYYDSQSGMHVPTHNENEVSMYIDWDASRYSNAIRLQLLDSMRSSGIHGAVVSSNTLRVRDQRVEFDSSEIAAATNIGFDLFWPVLAQNDLVTPIHPTTDSRILMYVYEELTSSSSFSDSLADYVACGMRTSLWLGNGSVCDSSNPFRDPICLANGVASLIDTTGGCDFVWISQPRGDTHEAEDTIQLCEELSYLDVRGPTIKSRLVVDLRYSNSGELAEECIGMGVNKFLLEEEQMDWLRDLVEESGKELRT